MIKIAGIMLISSAVAIWGNILSQRFKRRIALRNELLHLLEHLISGIKYGSGTFNELYDSFDSNIFKNGIIFDSLEILDKHEQRLISDAFNCFGKSKSRENELLLLEKNLSDFENAFTTANASDKNKCTLFRKLSVIAALILAIILL